jgi:maleylacetate reductase
MRSFIYEILPARVIFGEGKLSEVAREVRHLGKNRAFVIATPQQSELAQDVAQLLGDACVGIHDKAVMHVPYETVRQAMQRVLDLNVDCLVAAGGGSTTGLAKAIALEQPLPILAIPTTYAGSEMTPIWGITKDGLKTTGRNANVKPKTVIYDPKLTVSLPPGLSATSGMNAIAHCVEALYAENANPIASIMAEEGIRVLGASLPEVVHNPCNLDARSDAQYGAWLAGAVLGIVGMALHHKLCHVLGGTYNLPHAETHTVVLPHAIAYNASHAPDAMEAVGRALNCDPQDVAGALYDLEKSLNTPTTLAELGLTEDKIDETAKLAVKNPYYNPRPVTEEGIRGVLERAYFGHRPSRRAGG